VPVGYGGDALELIDDVGVLNLPVPGAEHLVREFPGVTEAAGGDLLSGLPHPSRQDSTGLPRYGGRAARRAASLRGYRVTPLQLRLATASTAHRISLDQGCPEALPLL